VKQLISVLCAIAILGLTVAGAVIPAAMGELAGIGWRAPFLDYFGVLIGAAVVMEWTLLWRAAQHPFIRFHRARDYGQL